MTHNEFRHLIGDNLEITVRFDLDFDGTDMTIQNIKLFSKNGIEVGQISHLLEIPQIHSINPSVYDESVKDDIVKQILAIAENEKPKFIS